MSSEYLSQSPNEFFVFLFGRDQHIYARLHRRLVIQEVLKFCHYLDLNVLEVRKVYEMILAQYWLEYQMGRLEMNINQHPVFFQSFYNELKSYKREQIQKRKGTA